MIRPLFDRIVVRRLEEPPSDNKIILPEAMKEKPTRAEVLAVGPGLFYELQASPRLRRPTSVEVGDIILFGKHTGIEVEHAGQTLLIMREEDVLAVE